MSDTTASPKASKLSSLRITQVPAAFAEMAAKHNALVALLENINGLTLTPLNGVVGDGSADLSSLDSRVTALETLTASQGNTISANSTSISTLNTLTSGLSRQSITYCTGGSSSSHTILMS